VPQGYVRAANFVPIQFGADFCYRKVGDTQYTGPVLTNAGVSGGLSFGQMTRYLALPDPAPSGGTQYEFGAVAVLFGAPDCSAVQATATLTVRANTYQTAFGAGSVGSPSVNVLTDDGPVANTSAGFRFANAAQGNAASAVDLREVAGNSTNGLFNNVGFLEGSFTNGTFSGSFGTVDANGYLVFAAPAAPLQLRVRTHGGGGATLDTESVTLAAGSRHSLFFIGDGTPGSFAYHLLDCLDELAPGSGSNVLATCQ